jgi:hypothetical protein
MEPHSGHRPAKATAQTAIVVRERSAPAVFDGAYSEWRIGIGTPRSLR